MQMRLKSGDKAGFQDFSQIGWTDPVQMKVARIVEKHSPYNLS